MRYFLAIFLIFGFAHLASAQSTQIPFGGLEHDATLPVEVVADTLQVDQSTGNATFIGNVVIGQGEMRLTADTVIVEYKTNQGEESGGKISRLRASGNVVLVNGPEAAEAAEAAEAVYTIDSAEVVMTGDVVLTQGSNALSANQMTVDLNTGRAQMSGRVKTILQSSN
ncbi:lipopolysaccharide transport periplasmic protein LptA [Falsihalocynthiibacter sp. SS001]|uniref:lipopolysaccharide transport periplasmic protein LptA n=1 Tax=Falsihalocynthiibacter sp. SS001 TaxID=3349698 RepID=UPI0036D3E33E